VLQAKLIQLPRVRKILGVPALPDAAKTQEIGPILGWHGVEFAKRRMKK